MILRLNGDFDKPISRLATSAKRALIALALWNKELGPSNVPAPRALTLPARCGRGFSLRTLAYTRAMPIATGG